MDMKLSYSLFGIPTPYFCLFTVYEAPMMFTGDNFHLGPLPEFWELEV